MEHVRNWLTNRRKGSAANAESNNRANRNMSRSKSKNKVQKVWPLKEQVTLEWLESWPTWRWRLSWGCRAGEWVGGAEVSRLKNYLTEPTLLGESQTPAFSPNIDPKQTIVFSSLDKGKIRAFSGWLVLTGGGGVCGLATPISVWPLLWKWSGSATEPKLQVGLHGSWEVHQLKSRDFSFRLKKDAFETAALHYKPNSH